MNARSTSLAALIAATVIAVTAVAGRAAAQADERPRTRDYEIEVVPLSHVRAADAAQILLQLGLPAQVSVDERTNSLIIAAPGEPRRMLRELTAQLDVEQEAAADEESAVKVYELRWIRADDDLAARLQGLFRDGSPRNRGGGSGLRIASAPASNQLIAQGTVHDVTMLDEVIAAVDRQPADGPGRARAADQPAEMRVRLAWLVNGDQAPRTPPADLAEVLDELRGLGIDDLGLAAQCVVRVTAGRPFETRFGAQLAEPWQVIVRGDARTGEAGARTLSLEIAGNPGGESLGTSIETTITTASGHFVVLGTAPILTMDSVFVVQLLDVR